MEGTRYGNGNLEQAGSEQGGDGVRGRKGIRDLEQASRNILDQRKRWTDNSPLAKERIERERISLEANAGRESEREYGEPIEGSTSAVGVHFSQQRRSALDSEYYGTGIRGLESQRLEGRQNDDIRPRIYFYVDKGTGVVPESGVGGVRHTVKLNNLYDVKGDKLGIAKEAKGDYNAFERAVKNSGFDGYLVDNGGNQKFAVLIGKHRIDMRPEALASAKDYDYDAALGAKFERIRRFNEDYDGLVNRIREDARNGNEGAAVMRLIARTGFRIGSVGMSGGEPTFGASSLKPEHVTINGDTVTFNFRGKSGVQQVHSIIDPEIARDLESRMDREFLFKVADRAVR